MKKWQWRRIDERGIGGLADLVRLLNERMLLLTHYLSTIDTRHSGVRTLADGDATPSVSAARTLVTANTSATSITAIDDGQPGWDAILVVNDANTTIVHGANLQLIGDADFAAPSGSVLTFHTANGETWREAPQPHRWS